MNQQLRSQTKTTTKWAPWWVYFVIIVGTNYLRRAAFPDGNSSEIRVAIALGFSAALFVIITLVYRAAARR